MFFTTKILRPDWQTKAFATVEYRNAYNDWEYTLVSYDTIICRVYKEYSAVYGYPEYIVIEFNECYKQSVTTSKHFRWFMKQLPHYVREPMEDYAGVTKSTREFMDKFGVKTRIRIPQ
nr:MAG TPA: hypothetical protein [Caudoviricetes sp.]